MDKRHIQEAEAVLAGLPRFASLGAGAYKPGLDRIERLLASLEHPQDAFETVHVAGTNGKGSTASVLAAIATAAGMRTGLHTSPHLFHVAERMRVDGRPAPEAWLAEAVLGTRGIVEEIGPSYFELTLALSLLHFAEQAVDLAVVEVGMGGRLDATNVLAPILSVITDVGLDHTEFLGGTIQEVAREKAGIVKPGVPVVTSARPPASDVIRAAAKERGAACHFIDGEVAVHAASVALDGSTMNVTTPVRSYDRLYVGLPGRHQIRNACTALRSAELTVAAGDDGAGVIRDGLRHVRELSGLRGRLEILRAAPLVVADVAHNADGLAAILDHLEECGRRSGRLTVLLGVMQDKDLASMARRLRTAGAAVRPVALASDRARTPGELAASLQVFDISVGEPCTVEEGVQAFLSDASHTDTLLITGSHLVVAQLESAVS